MNRHKGLNEEKKEENNLYQNYEEAFRICFVGKSFVGKTQLINRIVNSNFCEEYEMTSDEQLYRLNYNPEEEKKKGSFA